LNLNDHTLKTFDHLVERRFHLADLILAPLGHDPAEVAFGDPPRS
jgi:hypothetical protein